MKCFGIITSCWNTGIVGLVFGRGIYYLAFKLWSCEHAK